jgi:hypothetical protein
VWLRVRILNSLVFSLRITVRAIRDSRRDANQSFSAGRRIIGSVSAKRTSLSKVSSTEIDWVNHHRRFAVAGHTGHLLKRCIGSVPSTELAAEHSGISGPIGHAYF